MRNFIFFIFIMVFIACKNQQKEPLQNDKKFDTSTYQDINGPTGGTACVPNSSGSILGVNLIPQETSMWCWAACGQMCMSFLGKNIAQCVQANNALKQSNCCATPQTISCVQGGWPEFTRYGFNAQVTNNSPLSWEAIKYQTGCLMKPVAFSWQWIGGGGHMMVITGYKVVNNQKYVHVYDPLPENIGSQKIMTYEAYVSGFDYTHWNDYYNISKMD